MISKLSYSEIHKACDPKSLNCKSTAEGKAQRTIFGQERAVHAMRFGLDIQDQGFNIFAAGVSGTGRTTAVKRFLESISAEKPTPSDWCYVHNFEDSYRPKAIRLPASMAHEFQKDLDTFYKAIVDDIRAAFEGENYAEQREASIGTFQKKKEKIFKELGKLAKEKGFGIQMAPMGIVTIPLKDGKPISEEEFLKMEQEQREQLNQNQGQLQEEIEVAVRQTRDLDKEVKITLDELDQQVAQFVLHHLVESLEEKYKDIPDVLTHLDAIHHDVLENLSQFKAEPKDEIRSVPEKASTNKYLANTLVDNSKVTGRPVVLEMHPTYSNLFGRIEQEAFMGALVTDFTLIRGGSLHQANGGYLILPAEDVIRNPFTWESLKRSLRNREISIEQPVEQPVFTTKSLRPEPIPLDVKVILIGRPDTYHLLLALDDDFSELFKVKADFDSQIKRNDERVQEYISFVCTLCENEELKHVDQFGLARIVEHGSRLANDQRKLSTKFGELADLIREASYYAGVEDAELITAEHIEKTIEERFYRASLFQDRMRERMADGTIKIEVSGEKIGQVNGLSVLQLGDITFGQPSRITASVGLGKQGVVNVEREANMSGPIHTKGMLILSGYLTQKFAQDKPLSLNAHVAFEQNYGGVAGDSASSTELYAILSALSDSPIKQGIAVTGSVNQKGEVQAIGGVNEKIEGFFEICKLKGLTGEQGVMIPSSNKKNLMLKQEVIAAVEKGEFHIWSIETIEDGIEVLTGVKAGERGKDGTFEKNSIFDRADTRLDQIAKDMAKFSK
ncbi:MAG: Lon protease family protein [Candidatus Kariarchaeaceae archaeon]|jgi:lon-related putative ATP-dependent protease